MQDDSIRGGSFSFYPSPVHFLGLGFLSRPNAELAKQASSQYESAYSTAAKASEGEADRKSQTAENEARIGAENTRTANTIAGENARQQQRLAEERRTKGFEMYGKAQDAGIEQLKFQSQHPEIYDVGSTTAIQRLQSAQGDQYGLVGQYMNGAPVPQLNHDEFLGAPIAPSTDYLNTQHNKAVGEEYRALGEKTDYQRKNTELGRIQGGQTPVPSAKDSKGFVGAGLPTDLPTDVVNYQKAVSQYAGYAPAGSLKTDWKDEVGQDNKPTGERVLTESAKKRNEGLNGLRDQTNANYPFVIDGIMNQREGYQGVSPDAAPARALAAVAANLGIQPQDLKNPANRDRIVQQAGAFLSKYKSDPNVAQAPIMGAYQTLYDHLAGYVPTLGGQTQ